MAETTHSRGRTPGKRGGLSAWLGKAILIVLLLATLWRLGTGLVENPTLFAQQVVDGLLVTHV